MKSEMKTGGRDGNGNESISRASLFAISPLCAWRMASEGQGIDRNYTKTFCFYLRSYTHAHTHLSEAQRGNERSSICAKEAVAALISCLRKVSTISAAP